MNLLTALRNLFVHMTPEPNPLEPSVRERLGIVTAEPSVRELIGIVTERPIVKSAAKAIPAPAARPVAAATASPVDSQFVILLKNRKTGNFHAVMDSSRGPGAMASFPTREEAVAVAAKRWSKVKTFILEVK